MIISWPEWDKGLVIYINQLGNADWDIFWGFSTSIMAWTPLYLAFLFVALKSFTRRRAFAVITTILFALALTLLCTEIVKEIVQRPRPVNDPEVAGNLRLIIKGYGYSFFSGHASNSMAITTLFICFMRKRQRWVYAICLWPLLFGVSRLYFAVHYPIDVLVGWTAGFLIGMGIYLYMGRTLLHYAAYRETVPHRQ
ncbi:undecaprenyl-diphosphatase [Sinomicrobium oceani]|uniref:Undecaprenyl-diphosphatase n=1 Tax=Sinomicrobium oceani TaxID=1150368 RepID=A0A1K1MS82_9FLAO|nr:phosphatase PAP2 family protein [Sinomicrobium oceani]SFW26050.1 undecaprenyl-diphosphatase [Sinomicrobium oceani]